MSERIYLDNAATSWPKPEAVYTAIDHYLRENGAPAGRGAYREADEAERLVRDTRKRVASLIGAEGSDRIVFTLNGTDSLNMAIHGLLHRGGHVVTSVVEHNSVLRPLKALQGSVGVTVSYVECNDSGVVDPADVKAALQSDTKLVALTHASNVTGAVQPCQEVGRLLQSHDAFFLVDAAQSLGRLPLTVNDLGADLLAAPGHKGLYGPLGCGVLYLRSGMEEHLAAHRQGGTGTQSDEDVQPTQSPEKYESGNLNLAGIAGLHAGLGYLAEKTVEQIQQHEQQLTQSLRDALTAMDSVKLYGPADAAQRVGVVSFNIQGYDCREVASMLDTAYSIQCRAGVHCAPRMHAAMGTLPEGAVRFAPGPFNTRAQIDTAIEAVQEISESVFE